MSKEFHDLAEQALNHESGGASCWGNLGFWQQAKTYPQAAMALADQLGVSLGLNSQTTLLDVGFGCGDQVLHWAENYGVRDICGLNLSKSQTDYARQLLIQAGMRKIAEQLHQGDASQLGNWASAHLCQAPDTILALDCAYHFQSRKRFVTEAATVLAPGGQLGVTDLVLAQSPLRLSEQLPLRAIARLSHIPWANLLSLDDYRKQWAEAGFKHVECTDLTEHVFLPFGDWLKRYRASLAPQVSSKISWTKYSATASFLRWAQQSNVLRYVLCTGRV